MANSESCRKHSALAFAESRELGVQGLTFERRGGSVEGRDRIGVFDHVAQHCFAVVAQWGRQRHDAAAMLLHQPDALSGDAGIGRDLFAGRLAIERLPQLCGALIDEAVLLANMRGHADGARCVVDRAANGLANPPCCVGAELEALGVVELLDRFHQADVAFLNQVEQAKTVTIETLGDADHQTQVALNKCLAGGCCGGDEGIELGAALHADRRRRVELLLRRAANFDAGCKCALVFDSEQSVRADLFEIAAENVVPSGVTAA
ncbi:unannotated protein [freshwater metagenome]|uniref:Unannotated protein n=1 Tax=freshwater metagenome TaxID=449393 RepID=A0A6J6YID2_9ZZZZ